MVRNLIVIGAGGFGRETLNVVEAINASVPSPVWHVLGVIDDATKSLHLDRLAARGYQHLGSFDDNVALLSTTETVIAVGAPQVRAKIAMSLPGPAAPALVHPTAVVAPETTLGEGSVLCAGAQVSTNVTISGHVHVNPGAIIGHDVQIGNNVSINPGAIVSGEVVIEDGAMIGAGAVILQGLRVGAGAVVGAGSVVTRDVESGAIVKGSPAK